MSQLIISRMNSKELGTAIEWAKQEGWNPGLHDASCFYATDPNGFFVGRVNGIAVAVGSAVVYDDNFAFCGFYIVHPDYRNQDYGIQLTQARLEYVKQRVTGLDGVLDMADKYAKIGYKTLYYNKRYVINTKYDFNICSAIVDVNNIALEKLLAYDRRYFPTDRSSFIKCWIKQPQSFALGYVENDELRGYGVIRKCFEGFKIGPLFAESTAVANTLIQALVTKAGEPPFFIDIPEPNIEARQFISDYAMQEVFTTARMYRNGQPQINLNRVYANTTFELG